MVRARLAVVAGTRLAQINDNCLPRGAVGVVADARIDEEGRVDPNRTVLAMDVSENVGEWAQFLDRSAEVVTSDWPAVVGEV